ncbi:LysE family translocator [Arthrobacter sp. H14]|uniref:LysE family translocator n=1 Tax=Arthrobacter sp. H14 TaxID=1312959 RepID=UPI000479EF00|nr:LysE family translocator [Arthrobacter sp. H14]
MPDLLSFIAVCLVIIVVPGPDFALTLRNTAQGGRSAAVATAAGVMTGNLILASLAVAGLTAILRTSETAYMVLTLAGGAYLLYLGITSLIGWWQLRTGTVRARQEPAGPRRGAHYRQGMICNLSNPKVAVFYLALLPQFQLGELTGLWNNIALAAVFLGLSVIWYVALCSAIGVWERLFQRPRVRQFVAAASGLVLVALGTAALAGSAAG